MANVAVVGASDNPEKYSYLAIKLLREKGHNVFPVHPTLREIEGLKVFHDLKQISETIDTMSLYISQAISSKIAEEIIEKSPQRIIFNPGAENPELFEIGRVKGIQVLNACTLTMLRTGQF